MNNEFNKSDLPLGLGMALAQNSNAMTKFANLPDNRKREIIEQTHSLNSKQEMKEFVNRL
jgi:uncharacterized protein YdeI (YjbR/CyaY-like superfamily)